MEEKMFLDFQAFLMLEKAASSTLWRGVLSALQVTRKASQSQSPSLIFCGVVNLGISVFWVKHYLMPPSQIHARGQRLKQCEAVGQSRSRRLTNQPKSLSGSEESDGGGWQDSCSGGCWVSAQAVWPDTGKKNLHYKKRKLSVYT